MRSVAAPKFLAIFLLGLLLAACAAPEPAPPPPEEDPVVGGRPVSAWAAMADQPDGATRLESAEMLTRAGGTSFRHAHEMLTSADSGERQTGAEILRRLGPAAKPAAPELARRLQGDSDANVRAAAARALGAMGEDAASQRLALESALADETWTVRYHAATALGNLGWRGFDSRVLLEQAAHNDPDSRVRDVAAVAHRRILDEWYLHQKLMRR